MVKETINQSLPAASKYFELTNKHFGMGGFSAAFACIGTDNPVLYAYVALLFVSFSWWFSIRGLKRRLGLLRVVGIRFMRPLEILRACKIGLAGGILLALVASGFLDKHGFNPNPASGKPVLRVSLQ